MQTGSPKSVFCQLSQQIVFSCFEKQNVWKSILFTCLFVYFHSPGRGVGLECVQRYINLSGPRAHRQVAWWNICLLRLWYCITFFVVLFQSQRKMCAPEYIPGKLHPENRLVEIYRLYSSMIHITLWYCRLYEEFVRKNRCPFLSNRDICN